MKVSVILPGKDVAFLDAYAQAHGMSRSAAVRRAIHELRRAELSGAYGAAWHEWVVAGEAQEWESNIGGGIVREALPRDLGPQAPPPDIRCGASFHSEVGDLAGRAGDDYEPQPFRS